MTSQALLREALQLSEAERADLVAELLSSLSPPADVDDDVEAAWSSELTDRARHALGSQSSLTSWSTVKQRVEARLAE
jgi:hypothetical protein